MTKYQNGDVVVVPFPFTDGKTEKRRPALVVSAPHLATAHQLYWLVMITSADNQRWPDDVMIGDLPAAGLMTASLVRPAKITTLQEDRILRAIGKLTKKDVASVHAALQRCLA